MICTVLRLLRIANDMSRNELSEKTGLSKSYISEIEHGSKKPSLETIEKYSSALDIPVSTIMFFTEQATENDYNFQKILLQILEKITQI